MTSYSPKSASTRKPRNKTVVPTTDYISAEVTGHLPLKRRDNLVPFEMRDLERIKNKLQKAKISKTSGYYQNLTYLFVGILFSVATFLGGLYLTVEIIPPIVQFVSWVVIIVSVTLAISFWRMNKKLQSINENIVEDVLDDIDHLKNKFLFSPSK